MMKKIFKYPLKNFDKQGIKIPAPARLLSVMEQDGNLVLYAVVEDVPNWEYETLNVFIRGTGHPMGDAENADYLGTVSTEMGLVWHIFYTRLRRLT